MFDLIIKNATFIPDGLNNIDIACAHQRIEAIERNISAEAKVTLDAQGFSWLRLPLLIHISIWMPHCPLGVLV